MNDQRSEPDLKPPQGTGQDNEQRSFHRMAVRWDATLTAGSEPVEDDCLVLDISPGGAQVQTPDPLPAETVVALTLRRGGRFSGKVAWQQGSYFGITFERTHDDFLAG